MKLALSDVKFINCMSSGYEDDEFDYKLWDELDWKVICNKDVVWNEHVSHVDRLEASISHSFEPQVVKLNISISSRSKDSQNAKEVFEEDSNTPPLNIWCLDRL